MSYYFTSRGQDQFYKVTEFIVGFMLFHATFEYIPYMYIYLMLCNAKHIHMHYQDNKLLFNINQY